MKLQVAGSLSCFARSSECWTLKQHGFSLYELYIYQEIADACDFEIHRSYDNFGTPDNSGPRTVGKKVKMCVYTELVEICSSTVCDPGNPFYDLNDTVLCSNLVEGQATTSIRMCATAVTLGNQPCISHRGYWVVSPRRGFCKECNDIARLFSEEERLHAKVVAWARRRYELLLRCDPQLLRNLVSRRQ